MSRPARDVSASQSRVSAGLLDRVEAMVARRHRVPLGELRAAWRGSARGALARHVAMYAEHVVLELSLAAIARRFGRHPSAVLHACRRIEDLREEATFDGRLCRLEREIATLAGEARR